VDVLIYTIPFVTSVLLSIVHRANTHPAHVLRKLHESSKFVCKANPLPCSLRYSNPEEDITTIKSS
jgi:hypothetical protein